MPREATGFRSAIFASKAPLQFTRADDQFVRFWTQRRSPTGHPRLPSS